MGSTFSTFSSGGVASKHRVLKDNENPEFYKGKDSKETFYNIIERNTEYDKVLECSCRYEIYVNRKSYHWYILVRMENSRLPFATLEVTTPDMQTLLSCVSIQEDDTGKEYVGTDMTTMKELCEIADTVKNKMGGYYLLTSNCQHFCNNVLRWLNYETYPTTIGPDTTLQEIEMGFDALPDVQQRVPLRLVGEVVAGTLAGAGILPR